jgi:hypothetical protein
MPREVYLVLFEFGQTHEQAALALLIPTLHRLFPGALLRGAVVDNSLARSDEVAIDNALDRVSGDNTLREFSGWDRGIAWLERRYSPATRSIFVLANDTWCGWTSTIACYVPAVSSRPSHGAWSKIESIRVRSSCSGLLRQ